jgi:hypothetical protein
MKQTLPMKPTLPTVTTRRRMVDRPRVLNSKWPGQGCILTQATAYENPLTGSDPNHEGARSLRKLTDQFAARELFADIATADIKKVANDILASKCKG